MAVAGAAVGLAGAAVAGIAVAATAVAGTAAVVSSRAAMALVSLSRSAFNAVRIVRVSSVAPLVVRGGAPQVQAAQEHHYADRSLVDYPKPRLRANLRRPPVSRRLVIPPYGQGAIAATFLRVSSGF